jgi:hypothetical protein
MNINSDGLGDKITYNDNVMFPVEIEFGECQP